MQRISANYVFSPDKGFIKNGILELTEEGKIMSIKDPGENFQEKSGMKFYNGIITPGFINAHCHLELSHLKGKISEHTGLDKFIHKVVTVRDFKKEIIETAMAEADAEMYREGIAAVGDISNNKDSFHLKSRSKIHYHTFVEIFHMQNNEAEKIFTEGLQLLDKAKNEYALSASLTPHAPYSVSEKLFELFRVYLNKKENRISIHNQETEFENEFIAERRGKFLTLFEELGFEKGDSRPRKKNSLPWLSEVIPDESPLVLVHNVYTTIQDIENSKLDMEKTFFCLCPNSNSYISSNLPGTTLIENYPERICIGTDSLSSNHRLSILSELFTLDKHYPSTGLDNLLRFATINGAKALGIDKTMGSFEPGKSPGVNLIENADLHKLHLTPYSKVIRLI